MREALSTDRQSIFSASIDNLISGLSQNRFFPSGKSGVRLYDHNGRPISRFPSQKSANLQFERRSASRAGSLKTWIPRQLDKNQAARERETIAERAVDLCNNDGNAQGILESFANSVVGPGLYPHPTLDSEFLGITNEQETAIKARFKNIWRKWSPFADAAGRMTSGAVGFLAVRQLIQFGEYFFSFPMLSDPLRPYALAVQSIHPLRVKTPVELLNQENVKDGLELDPFGATRAAWIRKADSKFYRLDTKENFVRITARRAHRFRLIHGFIVKDAEQLRGVSALSPAIKMFRDVSDYLDAELVSNIVTAAFSVWIETGSDDPFATAENFANLSETAYKSDGTQYSERYEELNPGQIYYGSNGERPHVISAQRPGATFEPFVRLVFKSISSAVGVPHPVLFRDFEGMNYASYRSAMLEAWRVFKTVRKYVGDNLFSPIYRMLIEESYLKGELDDLPIGDFYSNFHELLSVDWIGPPKGQIEPNKEIQAEVLAIDNKLKSRTESALEHGRDFDQIIKDQADEREKLESAGLGAEMVEPRSIEEIEDDDEGDQNQNNEG